MWFWLLQLCCILSFFLVKLSFVAVSPQIYCNYRFPWEHNSFHTKFLFPDVKSRGAVLPYMGHLGMCRCEGYGFQAVYSSIGYINQTVWV